MLLFQPHTLLLSWIVNVPSECYLLSLKVVQTVLCINPKAPTSIYKFSRLILHCLIEVVERICLKIKAFSWRFSFHPSSETQGQSVGRKGATKVFKHERKSPWVPTLTGPFPNGQANAGSWLRHKKCFVLLCPMGEQHLLSWYTTAIPGSPRMHFIKKTSWCWSVDEN